jgi:general secretion pathway protein D
VTGVSLPGGRAATTGQPGEPPPIFRQEVRIVADEVTNSLVILATRRDYQLILDILRRIDVVPRQVVLEVMIAEVTLTNDLNFGVEWAFSGNQLRQTLPRVPEGGEPIFVNRGVGDSPVGRSVAGLIDDTVARVPGRGAFAVITDRENFQVFLNALQTKTDVKMLSAPHVVAADNREAHILVGDSVPILTSTASNILQAGNTATVNSVQYRDTGKILTILPQVNSKGLVHMQIRQEVSAVGSPSFGNTGSPSFSTREAETTVVVQDAETVLIGGIIDDSIRHERHGVPWLMDAPFFGRFFRTDVDNVTRTELIVTITPYVMRSREESRMVTDEFTDRIKGLRALQDAIRARRRKPPTAPEPEPPPVPTPAAPETR